MIEASNKHRLSTFCRVLEVSRSGFYEWVERSTQPDPDTLALEVAARAAHARRECYGPKRLRTELAEMGFLCSLATVKRPRVRLGLKCRHRRHFVRTTDRNHALAIASNQLAQRFDQASAPNQLWVNNITYGPTNEGWLYMAEIKDLFTKEIVGWAMEDNMRTELVSKALWMAVRQERPKSGLTHHSDRGSQCASLKHRHALMQFAEIFDYTETFYNSIRRHSALVNLSPMDFT